MIERSSQNSIIMLKSNFEYKQHAGPTKVSALGSNCSLVLKPEKKYCSIFIKKMLFYSLPEGWEKFPEIEIYQAHNCHEQHFKRQFRKEYRDQSL